MIDPAIENCLFGAVTWTKNADIDKYKLYKISIQVMELDLIEEEVFYFQVVDLVKI